MKGLVPYLALRAGVGFVGILPAGLARSLGSGAGGVWYLAARGRRKMAARHLTRIVGPEGSNPAGVRRMFSSYGRYWAEALWARSRRIPEMLASTDVEGLELLLEAHGEGKGIVVALPHMGNWEAAAPVAVSQGIPVLAVAENLPNRRITKWFTALRQTFGIEIVLATGTAQVMRALESALAANKAVTLLSDRDLKGRGVEVEFFGEKTTLPPGPASLALRSGAPLLTAATYFSDGGHRVVIASRIPIPTEGTRTEKIQTITQEIAKRLEDSIRKEPYQWHLVQPNWPSDRST